MTGVDPAAGLETVVLQHAGLRFSALSAGSGPVVLQLHGFPDHPPTFGPQLRALASAGRAVAAWLRGYEPSSQPADGDYSMAALAGDVLGWLLGYYRTNLRRPAVLRRLVKPPSVPPLLVTGADDGCVDTRMYDSLQGRLPPGAAPGDGPLGPPGAARPVPVTPAGLACRAPRDAGDTAQDAGVNQTTSRSPPGKLARPKIRPSSVMS